MDRRKVDPLKERISALPEMKGTQAIPHKPSPPPTSPPRLGFGKLVVPAKKIDPQQKPERLPLAVKSAPEPTRVDYGYLQPAPGSAPAPAVVATDKNFPPPIADPRRSISPPPSSTAFQVKAGDVDFRFSKGTWARLRPYVLWLALPLAGTVTGYYQGLRGAGERMRATEARTAALAGEVAELRATHDAKLKNVSAGLAREGVLTSDHESRLDRLEPAVELHGERLNGLAKQRPIIVKPSGD